MKKIIIVPGDGWWWPVPVFCWFLLEIYDSLLGNFEKMEIRKLLKLNE